FVSVPAEMAMAACEMTIRPSLPAGREAHEPRPVPLPRPAPPPRFWNFYSCRSGGNVIDSLRGTTVYYLTRMIATGARKAQSREVSGTGRDATAHELGTRCWRWFEGEGRDDGRFEQGVSHGSSDVRPGVAADTKWDRGDRAAHGDHANMAGPGW